MHRSIRLQTLWYFCIGLILVICCTTLGVNASSTPLNLYVSPIGNDSWSGKIAAPNPEKTDGPFHTLERVRHQIRTLKKAGKFLKGGVTINLREGIYERKEPFILNAEDSGTKDSPIVYRPYLNEQVRLSGGKEIQGFYPVNDEGILKQMPSVSRGKILQVDLKAQGITDYGELSARGFGRPDHLSPLELFFADQPMQIARWPNQGYLKIADVPTGKDGGKFTYEGDRPQRWSNARDIWLHGYWTWDWADSYEKVKLIDTQTHEITTEPPHGIYGYTKGQRYYVLNLLEELDTPGEYYLDRQTGILYFWPPSPVENNRAIVSMMKEPLVSLNDASYITLSGLIFEDSRGAAIRVVKGENVLVAGCQIRNIGTNGVEIKGGIRHGVISSDVYNIGETGIVLNGGDRKTLTPAKHYAVNNHIHNYARWVNTLRPGISIQGVGNLIAHNLIHDAPHNAILLAGNNHIIEFNNIHHVCLETGDAGAFYMGRDYTQQGNIIRYNYFHNLYGFQKQKRFTEVMAVYLDDGTSGTTIYGNLFYKVERGVLIGGGRNNTVENNIFVKNKVSVSVDARFLGWAKAFAARGGNGRMVEKLEDMNYKHPPYSTRYPQLVKILEDEYGVPKGNKIIRNVYFGDGWLKLEDKLTDKTITIEGNLIKNDVSFVIPNDDLLQLKSDSTAYKFGFQSLPINKIGLYKDKYRKAVF
ncbi:MAG: right-handed parallel beta-helix repeat-containing protein [Nostoc sp.]|uniref:right-handed parallel beta-helix repeat-containing protein n=1 Tax=Nostoc sp. TaxID=1180 RepID=UPI002FF4D343